MAVLICMAHYAATSLWAFVLTQTLSGGAALLILRRTSDCCCAAERKIWLTEPRKEKKNNNIWHVTAYMHILIND